jgi:hypothetical protein
LRRFRKKLSLSLHYPRLQVSLQQMFHSLKDSLASAAAKTFLASTLDRYGKIIDFRIRSRERTISAELLLQGDEVPVSIEISRYRITAKSSEHAIVVESVTASRSWIQNLLEDVLVEKPLPVPALLLLVLGGSQN